MSFSFRLQRVLELREKAEQARARTLRDANENADLLREQANALHSLRTLQRESLDAASRGLISAGELQHVAYLIDQLDTRLAKASDDAAEAQRVALEAQQALQLASRDRRVLGRLKEKHAERWSETEQQRDRLAMDEIALSRFTRKRLTGDKPDAQRANSNPTRVTPARSLTPPSSPTL